MDDEDGIPIFTITIRSRLVDGEEELDWKIDGRAAAYQAVGAVTWALMEMHREHIEDRRDDHGQAGGSR